MYQDITKIVIIKFKLAYIKKKKKKWVFFCYSNLKWHLSILLLFCLLKAEVAILNPIVVDVLDLLWNSLKKSIKFYEEKSKQNQRRDPKKIYIV